MDPHRLVSVLGALAMLAVAYGLSTNRRGVKPRLVLWGVALQWLLGVFLLRLPQGRDALSAASSVVQAVLDQSYEGSEFVFGQMGAAAGGDSGLGTIFAFQVLPTIVFIASLFSILYYLGVMQLIVRGLAWLMMRTMGTSGAESLS
ncbi:MAG: Na+ dependent nucleoside transporter N-terminal domain-containing protein, partial [Nannocystaceae bacterium]